MAGAGKRIAEFVPEHSRNVLDALSKADLMEITYSLALRLSGSDSDGLAMQVVYEEYRALAANAGRKPRKL